MWNVESGIDITLRLKLKQNIYLCFRIFSGGKARVFTIRLDLLTIRVRNCDPLLSCIRNIKVTPLGERLTA